MVVIVDKSDAGAAVAQHNAAEENATGIGARAAGDGAAAPTQGL